MDFFFLYVQLRSALRPIGRLLSLRGTSLGFLALGLALFISQRGTSLDTRQVLSLVTGFARWISFQPFLRALWALL
jgi:hypothetical protein